CETCMVLPPSVPASGVVTAPFVIYLTTPRAGHSALTTIRRSFLVSSIISAVLCTAAAFVHLPASFAALGVDGAGAAIDDPRIVAAGAVAIGIALGVLILYLTGYYTSTEDRTMRKVDENERAS